MTEQAKVPAIRFAGFTDPWEQRELVDIAEIVGGEQLPIRDNSNVLGWRYPIGMLQLSIGQQRICGKQHSQNHSGGDLDMLFY